MAPYSVRSSLKILSILSFLSAISLLSLLPGKVEINSHFYSDLFPSVISIFNLAIIAGWVAFGRAGGISLSALSAIIAAWLCIKTDSGGGYLFVASFFISSMIGQVLVKAKDDACQSHLLRSEKLAEEINVFHDNIAKTKKSIASLEEKLHRYSTLKEVAEALTTDLSVDDISSLIIEKTAGALGKNGRMLLYHVDMKKQELMLSVSRDVSKVKEKKGDIFDNRVFRSRKSLIIEDITKDFRFSADDAEKAKESFRSLIETPLLDEGKVVGILRVDSMEEALFTHDDLRILDIIADLGSAAMGNAFLYARTQELALKDGLTGLAVRRYFMERFHEELSRAAINKGGLSFLIMDIDHFKQYNDTYGHAAGDLVLKHLARSTSSKMRGDDIIARYGGEEIAILLFGADKAKAQAEAEIIRKTIMKEPLLLRRHKANITVSIGLSTYPEDGVQMEDLIRVADERLYKAKAAGRNRVCVD